MYTLILATRCPYHTPLMGHAIPKFRDVLSRCNFREASMPFESQPIILDPVTTHSVSLGKSKTEMDILLTILQIVSPATALLNHLTHQLRWHKTLSRLYSSPIPEVSSFHTVGRGAKGLGVMLRGELRKRPEGATDISVEEFGVRSTHLGSRAII